MGWFGKVPRATGPLSAREHGLEARAEGNRSKERTLTDRWMYMLGIECTLGYTD